MAVPFAALPVVMRRDVTDALRLATREAVNVGAQEVTDDARRRVRVVLGPEQRLSRLRTRLRDGKVSRVRLSTIEAGGTRVNPYYRPALSTTKPVALVGARGPAHLIEHNRRGGYEVRPTRGTLAADDAADAARLQAQVFGTPGSATRLQRRPALRTPVGYFGKVTPGPIQRPRGGPITQAFTAATGTIDRKAADTLDATISRQLGGL